MNMEQKVFQQRKKSIEQDNKIKGKKLKKSKGTTNSIPLNKKSYIFFKELIYQEKLKGPKEREKER